MLFLLVLICLVCSIPYSVGKNCRDGVYYACTNGLCSCVDCDDGCAVCYDNCHCEHCAYGWWKSGDVCTECTAGFERCRVCSGQDQCTECYDGYGLWKPTGGCVPCPRTSNCVYCNARSETQVDCTQCLSKYVLFEIESNGERYHGCKSCTLDSGFLGTDTNALECTFDGVEIKVTKCIPGYALFEGKCYDCTSVGLGGNSLCLVCEAISSIEVKCTLCASTFGLAQDNNCYDCKSDIISEGTDPNALSCTVDEDLSYYRTITACQPRFALYETTGDNVCVSCTDFSTIAGASEGCNTCTAIDQSTVECTECRYDAGKFESYATLCTTCDTFGPHCKTCSAIDSDFAEITECEPLISFQRGWMLDPEGGSEGTCDECTDEGCLLCGPIGQCASCRSYRDVEHCYDVHGVYNDVARDVGILNSFVSGKMVLGVVALFMYL